MKTITKFIDSKGPSNLNQQYRNDEKYKSDIIKIKQESDPNKRGIEFFTKRDKNDNLKKKLIDLKQEIKEMNTKIRRIDDTMRISKVPNTINQYENPITYNLPSISKLENDNQILINKINNLKTQIKEVKVI